MAKSLKSEIPLETFSKVVESIYDCALDPNRWIDTAGMIAQLVGAEDCLLGVHDMKNVHHGVMFRKGGRGTLRASLRGKVRCYEPTFRADFNYYPWVKW